ncbi:sensor histidine kinase, partial [Paenibacillus sp. 598K]|uniref:sensor histidine kinase n=1 Tax=Paenibacillus sp. 598K TaxID=1117987 RepID=UPI0035E3F0BE
LSELHRMLAAGSGIDGDEGRSIGLVNVHERLRTSYGEDYGLQVESSEGAGTEVTLRLPAIRRERM